MLEPTRAPRAPRRIRARREPGPLSGFFRFLNGVLSFVFLLLLIGAVVAVLLRLTFDQPGPLGHATVTVIPKGEGVSEIASRLEKDGVVSDRRLFMAHYLIERLYSNITEGRPIQLKAGEFEIRKQASLRQVLDTLSEGKAVLYKITVPEGLTSAQIVERLRAEPNLEGEISEIPAEGTLLPDTYKFSRGMPRAELIDRMRSEHQRFVSAMWERRQKGLPIQTPEQAVILASIVEKETGRADERDRVAAVFVNRLKAKMRLQSDPTIVYGLVAGQGALGRAITRSDIDARNPYNTYQIDGLPPTPICNPGRSAIEATLNPARTSDLYFVADGTGGHTFSASLKEHNSAVQVWRKVEREMKAKQAEANAIPVPASTSGGGTTAPSTSPAGRASDGGQRAVADVPLPIRKPKR
ncbi:MAG TPA: endolytic transglycosylase MltG [Hyphomicrobiaceae bacterium]|nr:endolytic transglycosylase MltG [Hyphomicrobiaceae bacterium]